MSFAQAPQSKTGLPLAGIVDVVSLLLIYFVLTWRLSDVEATVPLDLPDATASEAPDLTISRIRISFDADGAVYLNDRLLGMRQLKNDLQRLYELDNGAQIIIRGDETAGWGMGMQLCDMARAIGFENITAASEVVLP